MFFCGKRSKNVPPRVPFESFDTCKKAERKRRQEADLKRAAMEVEEKKREEQRMRPCSGRKMGWS